MDVKAPKEKYDELSGVKTDIKKIEESIKIIQNSSLDYEFKTTFTPEFLTKDDIIEIGKWLEGSKKYFLQQFKNDVPLYSSKLESIIPYSQEELTNTLNKIKQYFESCEIRGV
jgi:pyruvate formate lyase activating enzyme